MNYGRVGYTVIEVMIFLAISGVLFVAAVGVFSGRREATQFTQTMQDLQSQIRSYANQASTSYMPDTGGLNCAVGPVVGSQARPIFTSGASSDECILLGRAIQVIGNSGSLYSYPVFGLKTVYNGSVNSNVFPTLAFQASPEPAIDNSVAPNWLGVDSYQLPGGFQFLDATLAGYFASGDQDLLLLYSSLQNKNTTGNEIDAYSVGSQYRQPDIKGARLKSCIEALTVSCLNPSVIKTAWKLCVTDGTRRAQLQVRATSTGITTSLNMDSCP